MSGSLPASTAGLVVSRMATQRALNINGVGQMIKVGAGWLGTVTVVTSAAAATSFYDAGVLGDRNATTLMFTIPASAAVGTVYTLNMPCYAGLAITPGAGTVTSCSFA